MDEIALREYLVGVPIPALKFYESVGSTNDEALHWLETGADEYSLIVADYQTSGRGRMGRRWETRPGVALAFSLILFPAENEIPHLPLFSPLCAMAVADVLINKYHLDQVEVKWPNDVLIRRQKVAGILVESVWEGAHLQGIVSGVGLNIAKGAMPPDHQVLFPATCLEEQLGQVVDRFTILSALVHAIITWRPSLTTEKFINAWNDLLAFKGEQVVIQQKGQAEIAGKLLRVDRDGSLCLETKDDTYQNIYFGDVHLRPSCFYG